MTTDPRASDRRDFHSKRNVNRCPECGGHLEDTGTEVHHRDGRIQNDRDENLSPRCPRCHHVDEHGAPPDRVPDRFSPPEARTTGPPGPGSTEPR